MGRKSTPRRRTKLNSLSMVNFNKSVKKRKYAQNKTRNSIKKLFNQLRDDLSSTLDDTVIEVDLGNETPKVQNAHQEDGSLIIIGDDDNLVVNSEPCPLHCSTPNNNNNPQTNNNSDLSNNFHEDVINLTREINTDSYFTIDLTNDSLNANNQSQNTVIDLDCSDNQNVSFSNTSLSMSGDSDVTVINAKRIDNKFSNRDMKKFANGIANMNSSERGKLLEFIAQKVFSGCKGPDSGHRSLHSFKRGFHKATETVEDTYIKEVIIGKSISRNSIGSNIYNPERDIKNRTGLRMIVIDGSNVAMQHTKGRVFSVKGIKICIDYFLQRGHVVKAFVPRFRCKLGKSTDGKLLDQLERQGLVVYTPSREIQGRMITSYDDRYIVQCAAEFDGVIVSGDNYRDLLQENPRWRHVIENRLLQFTWVGDMIMFPRDPLGRNGPTLEQFLKHPGEMML